jgi:hypothetical protein
MRLRTAPNESPPPGSSRKRNEFNSSDMNKENKNNGSVANRMASARTSHSLTATCKDQGRATASRLLKMTAVKNTNMPNFLNCKSPYTPLLAVTTAGTQSSVRQLCMPTTRARQESYGRALDGCKGRMRIGVDINMRIDRPFRLANYRVIEKRHGRPAPAITTTYSPFGFDWRKVSMSSESLPRTTDSYSLVNSCASAAGRSP